MIDPAFLPQNSPLGQWTAMHNNMTLRQYYAGLAMQGILCNQVMGKCSADMVALMSVKAADALLAELEKTTPT